jgi:hypothetical protein
MHEKTKDVVVNGHTYRIGRFRPNVGMYCFTKLRNCSEEDMAKIQKYTLRLAQHVNEEGKLTPVVMDDGKLVAEELQDDTLSYMMLFGEIWEFNFADFTSADASSAAGAASATNPSNSSI